MQVYASLYSLLLLSRLSRVLLAQAKVIRLFNDFKGILACSIAAHLHG